MEYVKAGQKILYVWGGEVNSDLEEQINALKANSSIQIVTENIDRLQLGNF